MGEAFVLFVVLVMCHHGSDSTCRKKRIGIQLRKQNMFIAVGRDDRIMAERGC